MKDQLTRMRGLYNYNFDGTITEEMEVSDNFNKNNFQKDDEKKSVAIEVSIDPKNDKEYRTAMIIRFTNVSGYKEFIFYFTIIDKYNKIVPGKETIYDKDTASEYLPKELQKSIIFRNKINEMFKLLITMEKPDRFFLLMHDKYKDPKQLLYHKSIVDLIKNNGYFVKKEDISFDGRYYWEFVKLTNKQIKESKEFDKFINNFKRDEEYYEKLKEDNKIICERVEWNKNIL